MKGLVQLLGAMLAAIVPLLTTDAPLTLTEWINVGVVAAGAGTVYIATNEANGVWAYAKFFTSLISAGGVVFISALGDGSISNVEWVQIAIALLAALSVWRVQDPLIGGRHARPE